jgi:hypothetical protein
MGMLEELEEGNGRDEDGERRRNQVIGDGQADPTEVPDRAGPVDLDWPDAAYQAALLLRFAAFAGHERCFS